jgi:hypothetical protein
MQAGAHGNLNSPAPDMRSFKVCDTELRSLRVGEYLGAAHWHEPHDSDPMGKTWCVMPVKKLEFKCGMLDLTTLRLD